MRRLEECERIESGCALRSVLIHSCVSVRLCDCDRIKHTFSFSKTTNNNTLKMTWFINYFYFSSPCIYIFKGYLNDP